MVENGFNRGNGPVPPDASHSEYEILCALATAGPLSAEEEERLIRHLSSCAACRQMLAQYEALAGMALPHLAVDNAASTAPSSDFPPWSLEDAEALFFAKLEKEEQQDAARQDSAPAAVAPSPTTAKNDALTKSDTLWRHMWWQYAAGVAVIAALGLAIYRLGIHQGAELSDRVLPTPSQPSAIGPASAGSPSADRTASVPPGRPALEAKILAQIAAQRAEIARQKEEIARLEASQHQAAADRDAKAAQADSVARERGDLEQQLGVAEASLQDLQHKLEAAQSQSAAEVAGLEARISQISDELHQRDQEVARERDLLDHDRDIRELMGARDLYIAEVYDVAKNGDTEKPFGRVFYTQGKSLVFYAYDLDQQPGVKNATTFQAWGRRGPDPGRAVNLGILFEDNTSKKRWMLKARDPKTLGEIDAVFVTVEPNGGSVRPSGKPFLWAYLRNNPNHP